MKPPARKAKSATQLIQRTDLREKEKSIKKADFFEETTIYDSDFEESSDYSDYGKRTTKKRKNVGRKIKGRTPAAKKRKALRQPSPEVPEMSETDSEEEREEDLRLFEKKQQPATSSVKATVSAKVLRLEVRSAPTTININLHELFPKAFSTADGRAADNMDGSTLLDSESFVLSQQDDPSKSESFVHMRLHSEYACFLELEPELRNRIYREMLVDDTVVKFNPAPRSSRQPAILQTCHQIYEEGRGILYGENAFHFERINKSRGRYYDHEYKEVGYKDVRRFLEKIGSDNIAKIRFLSFELADATPTFTPKLDVTERRYVNDAVLHHVLRLIGKSGCILDKFVVGFAGRSELDYEDVPFIRAFTSISCRQLIQTCSFGHSKISARLFGQIEDFMEAPKLFDIDERRQKMPGMEHERNKPKYGCPGRFCYRN